MEVMDTLFQSPLGKQMGPGPNGTAVLWAYVFASSARSRRRIALMAIRRLRSTRKTLELKNEKQISLDVSP